MFAVLLCASATAYRLHCAPEETGGEPVGWQRWRRQLLEQTRDMVIIFAGTSDGVLPIAEYPRRLGVKLKDLPPGIGAHQQIFATYGLAAHR
jgi:hypothetical protein